MIMKTSLKHNSARLLVESLTQLHLVAPYTTTP